MTASFGRLIFEMEKPLLVIPTPKVWFKSFSDWNPATAKEPLFRFVSLNLEKSSTSSKLFTSPKKLISPVLNPI